MAQLLSTNVVFPFSNAEVGGSRGGGGLSLEISPYPVTAGNVAIKIEPDVGAALFATKGSCVKIAGGFTRYVGESLQVVSGSDSIGSASPDVQILMSFDANGGNIGVQYSYDAQTQTVKFTSPFWGVVRVGGYSVSYGILEYTPEAQLYAGNYESEYGTVAAYYQGAVATLEIPPPGEADQGAAEFELWRITSKILVVSDGAYEYPTNNDPENPAYSPSGDGSTPDTDSGYLVTERVHQIAMGDFTGRVWVRDRSILLNKPYASSTFNPVKETKVGTIPDGIDSISIQRFKEVAKSYGINL